MVELLHDPGAACWKVIEVNPRAWGSFLLSEFCGAAFLENYIHTALGTTPADATPREDVLIRWLVPHDLFRWMREGMKVDRKNTCYVGFTHSTASRSLGFLLAAGLDREKLGKAARGIRAAWRS